MQSTEQLQKTQSTKPYCAAPIIENIPQGMKELPRWCVWRYARRTKADGSTYWTKVPFRSDGHGTAESNNPETWSTFDTALNSYQLGGFDGIGFMMGDGWTGIDMDDCLNEEERFIWGSEIVAGIPTYWEVSPSGTGIKGILRGNKPAWANSIRPEMGPDKIGRLEVFSHGRFFTVTGQVLEGIHA